MLLGYNFFSFYSHSIVGWLLVYLVTFHWELMLIVLNPWKISKPKIIVLFSGKHSYLLLTGVKGHRHPGTTLTPGSPPASYHTQCWHWHLPPGASPPVPTPAHPGARELRASLLSEQLYLTSNLSVCSEGVPQDTRRHFVEAGCWLTFFKDRGRCSVENGSQGQSGCWETGRAMSVLQVSNDGGFTQSGGRDTTQESMDPR